MAHEAVVKKTPREAIPLTIFLITAADPLVSAQPRIAIWIKCTMLSRTLLLAARRHVQRNLTA